MKNLTWFLFFALIGVSCLDEPDCYQLNNDQVGIAFRVIGSKDVADTISVFTTGTSGVDSSYSLTSAVLLLNFTDNSTQLKFPYLGGERVLVVHHSSKNQFVSEDCGSRFVLSDLAILDSAGFDSLRIVNATPTKGGEGVNIEILRCPQPDKVSIVFKELTYTATTKNSRYANVKLASINADYTSEPFYLNRAVATVHLPLDSLKKQTTFAFNIEAAETRELTFTYETKSEKRYKACKRRTFFTNLKLVKSSETLKFDSVTFLLDEDGHLKNDLKDPIEPNVQVFKCPAASFAQIAFREQLADVDRTRADSVYIKNITINYSGEVMTIEDSVSTIPLPLDETTTRSEFLIQYGDRTETLAVTYQLGRFIFGEGSVCRRRLITGLAIPADITNDNIRIADPASAKIIQYPPITNIEIITN